MMRAWIIAMALGVAHGALADGSRFYPPEGCSGFLTVQSQGCEVSHYYTCSADAPGDSWRADLSENGITYLGRIDSEAQWMDSYFFNPLRHHQIALPAEDPASFSELVANGVDTYDFNVTTPNGLERVAGFDRIVDDNVVIDGEPLQQTEYSVRATDENGDMLYEVQGVEYISTRHRRFFSGTRSGRNRAGSFSSNGTPILFVYPDEPGFFTKTPLYGCDALSASYPLK